MERLSVDSIFSQSLESLQDQFALWGEPRWRAGQLMEWIYRKFAGGFDECSNLSKPLRAKLKEKYSFSLAPLITVTGQEHETRKFLWRLEDGNLVESVLIPAGSEEGGRHTLCVSTQVGCAYGCRFCASGRSGFVRDLTAAEIVGQFLGAEAWHRRQSGAKDDRLLSNIVVMGMGEPLSNYENLMRALSIINAPWGGNLGARKITISTSGLAPQIRRLAGEEPQYRLAISLHAAEDAVRDQIMPVNRKYPLNELLAACEAYQHAKGRMISFEYILIDRINDTPHQCDLLAGIARRFHAHVNLIPFNKVDGCAFRCPPPDVIQGFFAHLQKRGISVTLRQKKGGDINAACGQLRLRKMGEGELSR